MGNVKKLLDQAMEKSGVTTRYGLAKALELPTQRISDYYAGKRKPDEFACMKIAEKIEQPLADVLYAVALDSENDETRLEAWKRYMKLIGGRAALFMIAACAGPMAVNLVLTQPAQAHTLQGFQSGETHGIQIMRFLRTLIAAARNMTNSAFLRFYWWYSIESGKVA